MPWSGTGALRQGEPWTSPWVAVPRGMRVLVESLPVVPKSWVLRHGLGECLSRGRGWVLWRDLYWHVGSKWELPFSSEREAVVGRGGGVPVAPGSWQALCLRRAEVPWAAWVVVESLGIGESKARGDHLPRVEPDATGRTVGLFDGRLVRWGRTTPDSWVVRVGRGGPRVCVAGATLQEELLIATGKVLSVQSGRSPSSVAQRIVGEPPALLPPGMVAPPAHISPPDQDIWRGSPKLPSLSMAHPRFRAVSRRRHTVAPQINIGKVIELEVAHASGWLQADHWLGTVALCGPVALRAAGRTGLERRRAAGLLDDGYWLRRAGWWRLAFQSGQGVGEVERYRAKRLHRFGKRTHLRRVQRLVLGYMDDGGVPLGVEISLTAQALATWLNVGRPDALVWLPGAVPTLVWVEVETRPIRWAKESKLRKFDQLRAALKGLAGALGVDVELCLQEVGNVTRERFRGHDLAQEAWGAGLRGRGAMPVKSTPGRPRGE